MTIKISSIFIHKNLNLSQDSTNIWKWRYKKVIILIIYKNHTYKSKYIKYFSITKNYGIVSKK